MEEIILASFGVIVVSGLILVIEIAAIIGIAAVVGYLITWIANGWIKTDEYGTLESLNRKLYSVLLIIFTIVFITIDAVSIKYFYDHPEQVQQELHKEE